MGVMRFSMAEAGRGMRVGMEDVVGPRNVVRTAQKMMEFGAAAMALDPGISLEITPPYLQDNEAEYYLTTPPEEPVDECEVFIVPNQQGGGQMAQFDLDKVSVVTGMQRYKIPGDTAAFALTTTNPYGSNERNALLVHELIIPQPGADATTRIEGLRNSPLLRKQR